jgi:leader peptidase (prepilin peptidase) / N-methyltransferase
MALYAIVFVFGALIGSFLNVCIYRMPRKLSIVLPSSRCPSCGNPIKPWDNIPLVSYLFLGGKCRYCRTRIPFRYPLVEGLNALCYAALLWRFGPGSDFLIYCVFCSSLIVITFVDLDFQIIPDRITIPGVVIGLAAGSFILPDPFMRADSLGLISSLIGAAGGFGLYYLIAFLSIAILKKEGMGGGDIKMMAMVGGFMGWKAVILTTFLGSLGGSVVGIAMIIMKGREKGSLLPFGPFLSLGALISLFFGQEILIWYLH